MASIQIFNVCTHAKDGGLSMAIPTACVISPHPTYHKRFVTGGGDCNVFIWHFSNSSECGLEQIAKLTYHTKQVNAVAWNANGDELVTSGDDKMIAIWTQDTKYDYLSNSNKPSFGETMIFREKWLPLKKIRGPLAEVSDIKYMNNSKDIIVSSLDGSIAFYNVKKQQHLLTMSLPKNIQFVQGISVDYTSNLLAIQTNTSSAKVYRIIKKHKNKKNKHHRSNRYNTTQFCSLSHYPFSGKEAQRQKVYEAQYKQEKKEMERVEMENNNNTNNKATKKAKPKKKRISKCPLFKQNLPTTSRQPHWSSDGLLLAMVAGQSKDKSNNCIHVFHRSNLTKKVTTFVLPESSHASCVRFNPLKLKINGEDVDKGSIVDKYGIKYKMLFAIICGSELFIFDTSKNNAVFYWKDQDAQNFFDMEWSFDGKALIISDSEGFITRISLRDEDVISI